MELGIQSISTNLSNVRQDVFPLGQWTITTRKGIIMQSKCTCKGVEHKSTTSPSPQPNATAPFTEKDNDREPLELCDICRYHRQLPHLHAMPDMLFNNNLLRLEHSSGAGIEFNPLDALKLVEETQDPMRVAVADGWQSARADCMFSRSIVKPFDWTFTSTYRGTLLSAVKRLGAGPVVAKTSSTRENCNPRSFDDRPHSDIIRQANFESKDTNSFIDERPCTEDVAANGAKNQPGDYSTPEQISSQDEKLDLTVEETEERINVNKLKLREEILFYDEVTLYEDELADHGTAQYTVKVRVMPSSMYLLARYYLRVDGVLARINDTRIYHDLSSKYMLREYTNREAKLTCLNLPVSTIINPNELASHLPLVKSYYERLILPSA